MGQGGALVHSRLTCTSTNITYRHDWTTVPSGPIENWISVAFLFYFCAFSLAHFAMQYVSLAMKYVVEAQSVPVLSMVCVLLSSTFFLLSSFFLSIFPFFPSSFLLSPLLLHPPKLVLFIYTLFCIPFHSIPSFILDIAFLPFILLYFHSGQPCPIHSTRPIATTPPRGHP